MLRPVLLALLVSTSTAPAVAQVINGETPLDETTLNRETPGPSAASPSASRPPEAARDESAPAPSPDPTSRARHE